MVERSSKSVMGLPANSSTAALMRKSDKQSGGLEVEFRGGDRSSHATTGQYITVAILFFVNLINYMDRMTIAGKYNVAQHGQHRPCGGGGSCGVVCLGLLQLMLAPRSHQTAYGL